jgi:TonB family protein
MNFFSNTQEASRRFGDYIEDLHDIFRCNRVDFGSPQDFVAFARTVQHRSELRNDVLRVVKSLRQDETNISFRTILTIIAVASGGPDVAKSDHEMSVPVQLIVESLNSVDSCSESKPGLRNNSYSAVAAPDQFTRGEEMAGHRDASEYGGVELPLFDAPEADSINTRSIDPVSDQGLSDDFSVPQTDLGGLNTLVDSLTRLESNSSQLKAYLDSIEERIIRIEPRLENVPSPSLPVAPIRPLDGSGAASNQGRVGTESTKIFPSFWGNAQLFSSFKKKGAVPIFLGATTLAIGASLLWILERDSGDRVRRSTNAFVRNDVQSSFSIKEPERAMISPVISPENTVPQTPKKKSATRPFRSPPRPFLVHTVKAETHPATTSETPEIAPSNGGKGGSSESLDHLPRDVSSDVMAANLVSGQKPSYPLLANLTHMQGSVVMQAVISKDGTVEHLHVIKGHRLLRNAAKNAVQSWRYRPYKVDGVPVEVATVVSVDFSRHHELNP